MKSSALLGVIAASLLLSACGSEGDIQKAFVTKYGKDLCMEVASGFPLSIMYENDINEAADAKWVQALVQEGVLVAGEVSQSGAPPAVINSANFDLSEQGRTFARENMLCYGKTEVDRVINYREYGEGDRRFLDAQVALRHVVTAPWANNPDLRGQVKNGREVIQRTMRWSENGWQLN